MSKPIRTFVAIMALVVVAGVIALPEKILINLSGLGLARQIEVPGLHLNFSLFGRSIDKRFELKRGLDIQGGMQVILQADMSSISEVDRQVALDSAREVMKRRVDLYGINEPVVQSFRQGDEYRLLVELAGVTDASEALKLVGTTANLEFRLEKPTATTSATATPSAMTFLDSFAPTGLTGQNLRRATVQFNPQTGEPEIGISFNEEGSKLFADLTTKNTGKVLAIFIDQFPIALPRINTAILDGQAVMSGGFTVDEAKQLAIQLNAGALPVPITVLEQRSIGASLGQTSVEKSVRAGVIGIGLVMLFMVLIYGWKGWLAVIALSMYALFTLAVYKLVGVTLTLPGIAGLLLSVGMAVDSNILIFERMKEELRMGKPFQQAMELGFGRAWDSIKDANVATLATAFILINPFDFPFLNTSGLVRGFGITLMIGVMISLFTGIVVTRTLMRLFLKGTN